MHGLAAFIVSLCLAGGLWLLAVAIVRRGGLPPRTIWLVLGIAVAMRLLTLTRHRYSRPICIAMYGMAACNWRASIHTATCRSPMSSRSCATRRYPHINRADYAHTLYPPAAQAIFALAAVITPGVFGMKVMIAAFDVLAIVMLIVLLRVAGRDPAELLIYAWLPLPVWEFAGNAHIDGVTAGLLALALLAATRGRSAWTGVVLAVATLTKFLPAVVLPAFWRPHDWRLPIAFAVTLVCLYLPYSSVGWQMFSFFPGYFSEEGLANGHGSSCWTSLAASCRCRCTQPGPTSRLCWPCWVS